MKFRRIFACCVIMLLLTPFARASYTHANTPSQYGEPTGALYDQYGAEFNQSRAYKHSNKHFSTTWLDTTPLWYSFSHLTYYTGFKSWVLGNDYYRYTLSKYKYAYHKNTKHLQKYLAALYVYYYYTQPKNTPAPPSEQPPIAYEPVGDVFAPAFIGGVCFLLFGLGHYRRSCYNKKP